MERQNLPHRTRGKAIGRDAYATPLFLPFIFIASWHFVRDRRGNDASRKADRQLMIAVYEDDTASGVGPQAGGLAVGNIVYEGRFQFEWLDGVGRWPQTEQTARFIEQKKSAVFIGDQPGFCRALRLQG